MSIDFLESDFMPRLPSAGGSVAIGGAVGGGATAGSILFVDGSGNLGQDNANLFWDDSNNRLGIGTATPAVALSVFPDTDGAAILGRARIDARTTDGAHFSHFDQTSTSAYAVWQQATGATQVNAASGQPLRLQVAGSTRFNVTSAGHLEQVAASLQFRGLDANGASAPNFSWVTDNNTGMYNVSADKIGWACGGALELSLDGTNLTFEGVTPKWVAANEQTTVGAAGGASALPATPTKYLKVTDSAGTTLVIPAYAAA